jgi:hypothetical protein
VFPSIRKKENPSDEAITSISENISRKSGSHIMEALVIMIILGVDYSIVMKNLNFIYKKEKNNTMTQPII